MHIVTHFCVEICWVLFLHVYDVIISLFSDYFSALVYSFIGLIKIIVKGFSDS